MFQPIIEKSSGALVPLILTSLAWYGAHYTVLTPRIMHAELKQQYQHFDAQEPLPKKTKSCFLNKLPKQVLQHGRFEASLYTSTFQHIASPYRQVLKQVETSLDETCGISLAKRKIEEERAHQRHLAKLAEIQRLKKEATLKLKQEQEKAKQKVIEKRQKFLRDLQQNPEAAITGLALDLLTQ